MSKKKKQMVKPPVEDENRGIIERQFESVIKTLNEQMGSSKYLKDADLEGPVLRRRKNAIYKYLPEGKTKLGDDYSDYIFALTWAKQNCVATPTVSELDRKYYLTMAIAIWMLDALTEEDRISDALRYFTKDTTVLDTIPVPEFFDPCNDDTVIREMMDLIRNRDPGCDPKRCYINDITAKHKVPIDHSAPPADEENMTSRERFNAVMNMIPKARKDRAKKRFEGKLWEFLDYFFRVVKPYSDGLQQLNDQLEFHVDQMADIVGAMETRKERGLLHRKRDGVEDTLPRIPLVAPTGRLVSDRFLGTLHDEFAVDSSTVDRLRMEMSSYARVNDRQDEVAAPLNMLVYCGPRIALTERSGLEEVVDGQDIDYLEEFDVEDPYEVCFGYLCLLEEGSDLPWLCNPSLAVLNTAASKFPWSAREPVKDDLLHPMTFDGSRRTHASRENTEKREEEEPSEPSRGGREAADWTPRVAPLYKRRYLDGAITYSGNPRKSKNKVNLAQLLFNMTGMIMPRSFHSSYGIAGELVDAGLDPGLAKGIELYLQLSVDMRHPNYDWDIILQDEAKDSQYPDGRGQEDEEGLEEDVEDIEELKKNLKEAKEKIKELRVEYHELQDATSKRLAKAEVALNEFSAERQELYTLRELIYQQANEHEYEGNEQENTLQVELPYRTKKRIVSFGGHDAWLKAIRPMLPGIVFVNPDKNPDANMVRGAEVVWIQPNALSHKLYYKIINIVRVYNIPVRYFGYSSARKCAMQVVEEDMKSDDST